MTWKCTTCGHTNWVDRWQKCEDCGSLRNYELEEMANQEEGTSSSYQSSQIGTMNNNKNSIASTFRVIAWLIFIGGFLSGLLFGYTDYGYRYSEFSFTLAMIYWVSAFVSGMVFLGFAEVISLLQELVNQTKAK